MAATTTSPAALYAILLVAALLMSSSLLLEAKNCEEDMGACDDCQNRCAAKHAGGQGTCDSAVIPATCRCNFPCQKTCNEAIPIAGPCVASDCNARCVAKHGVLGSEGYCNMIIYPYNSCYCNYYC